MPMELAYTYICTAFCSVDLAALRKNEEKEKKIFFYFFFWYATCVSGKAAKPCLLAGCSITWFP
jgi:hypothetical protein